MNFARLAIALASVLGGGLPVDRWGRVAPELPQAAPELPPLDEPEVDGLPASDAARLDAARQKRARKGAARIAQARRAGALLSLVLAALAACAPDAPRDECLRGEQLPCDGCSVGALRTNLRGVETCEMDDAGAATWGACRCSAGAP